MPKNWPPSLQIPDAYYIAIGKVASNWAAFEALVNSLLWQLAKVHDDRGACLTAQIANVARSLDALASLVRLEGGSETVLKEINRFAEKTGKLSRRRNRIIHDPWTMSPNLVEPHRLEISAQKRLIFQLQATPLDDILALVDAIDDHMDEFDKLANAVLVEIEPSVGDQQ